MRTNKLLMLSSIVCLVTVACSLKEEPRPLGESGSSAPNKEVGRPLIQRYITTSRENKILGDLCLITENAVTVTHSEYDTESTKNIVHTDQKFMDLHSNLLKESIISAIASPQIFDERSKSDSQSVSIFLFDHQKDSEIPGINILFSRNSSGIEKKDSPLAATLIATTEELCAAALIKD